MSPRILSSNDTRRTAGGCSNNMTNSPAMNHKCTVHRTSSDACRSRPRSNSTCHCPDLHHGKRQRYGYVLRSAMTYAIRAATNRTIEPSPSVKNHGVPHRSQKKRIESVARARKGSQDNYGRLTLCASLTARPMRAQRGPSTKERNMKWHMRTCEKKKRAHVRPKCISKNPWTSERRGRSTPRATSILV